MVVLTSGTTSSPCTTSWGHRRGRWWWCERYVCEVLHRATPIFLTIVLSTEYGVDWNLLCKIPRCTCSHLSAAVKTWDLDSLVFSQRQSWQQYCFIGGHDTFFASFIVWLKQWGSQPLSHFYLHRALLNFDVDLTIVTTCNLDRLGLSPQLYVLSMLAMQVTQ